MHNYDDKYLSRPGFEPDTPRLQAPVDTNEPSGPAYLSLKQLIERLGIVHGLRPPGFEFY